MKIACISQVRDECDIIELFVRINCRIFDRMFIIDNNSADATPVILKKLQEEGYPITTTFDGDNTYNQDGLMNQALHTVNAMNQYDWFFFLDADEFVDETKEDILEKLYNTPRHLTPKCMWKSWVPTSLDYFKYNNPLYKVFNPLAMENHITYKAVIDRVRAPHLIINHGNHAWARRDKVGELLPDHDCGVRINHFPVRSVEQITSKVVLSRYRLLIRREANKHNKVLIGKRRSFFQLVEIHEELRKSNFLITPEILRRWGVWYNTEIPPTGNDPQIDSAIAGEHFGFEDDIIQYPDLARIALGARFDKQMDIMHGVILQMHRKLQEFGVMR
jgi:glycosyltransferase involved in cell wall biosynthesis